MKKYKARFRKQSLMKNNHQENPQLHVHEWLAVSAICGLIAMLALLAFVKGDERPEYSDSPHQLIASTIDIYIEGAVSRPGIFNMPKDAVIQDVLQRAIPLPEADLKKVKSQARIRRGQVIKIPFKKKAKKNQIKKDPSESPL
jgi:hypothetical protein